MKRDRETQNCYGLLNKTYYFTIYYQNKRPETNKTFERERKRNLRGHHLHYTGLSHHHQDAETPTVFYFLFIFI